MFSFICQQCCRKLHERCPGHTWCDCQHKPVLDQSSDDPIDDATRVVD